MGGGTSLQLANAEPFALGRLRLEPATRQLRDGKTTGTLEPRVMQVLVVLADARGRVVGRQELIERCWDGRVVGEQAINRVIAILRKLAADHSDAFRIETITKVGYRLTCEGRELPALPPPASVAQPGPTTAPHRRGVLAIAAAGTVAAVGGVAALLSLRGTDRLLPEAQAFLDRGYDELDQGLPGMEKQAPAYFARAAELAPESARVWGGLAIAYATSGMRGDRTAMLSAWARARAAAQRAMALDRADPDARVALALAQPTFRRWQIVGRQFEALLTALPKHPDLLAATALLMGHVGRWRDAAHLQERWRAVAPDRLRPQFFLALSYWHTNRLVEAEALFDDIARRWPSHAESLSARVNLLVLTGQSDKAEAVARSSDPSRRMPAMAPPELAIAASRAIASGNREAQAGIARTVGRLVSAGAMSPVAAVAYFSTLGNTTQAFEVLGRMFFGNTLPWDRPFRPRWPLQANTGTLFGWAMKNLRDDPRFPQVTTALGLEHYWEVTGTRPDYRT